MAWGWRGRSGGWTGPWPGRGPFSYLPPWQRPGWLFGFDREFGRWWWGYPYNPWVCARFPWLPRWWWVYPQYWYGPPYASYRLPYSAYGGGYWYPWSVYPYAAYPYWFPSTPYIGYW
ncbi:MAG: hypothetical protein ACUVQW_06585 [Candidatus Bathycorpusculaceae bacterium]